MMKIVKNNPIKLISVGLLIVFLGLNCFGFCFDKMRFLSDQDRINIVVQKAVLTNISSYENTQIHWLLAVRGSVEYKKQIHVGTPEYFERTKVATFGKPIPYKNINEFFKQNPNCCQVVRSSVESEGLFRVSFLGCLTGHSPYLVSVKLDFPQYLRHSSISDLLLFKLNGA